MQHTLPTLEKVADALEAGDKEAVLEAMRLMMGLHAELMGAEMAAVRRSLQERGEIPNS